MSGRDTTRRDWLSGDSSLGASGPPSSAATLRLSIHAMACDFGAAVAAENSELLLRCGDALEVVPQIESWLSPWQGDSELSQLNAAPENRDVSVSDSLFEVLQLAERLNTETCGAFDITSGAQVNLWKQCREEDRIPTEPEISAALAASGMSHVAMSENGRAIRKTVPGLLFTPGAVGKGFALDQAIRWIDPHGDDDSSFLLHGGRSSVTARGTHDVLDGWPVGIGNPLLTRRRLGTVILRNQAMSTSGSNIQFFRCEGRRFGHILDPRTGWPVDGMLSVTVVADSAAVADAVSTAFFVLGVEKAIECCDNMRNIAAVLIPFPTKGARVEPVVIGIPSDQIIWDEELVALR